MKRIDGCDGIRDSQIYYSVWRHTCSRSERVQSEDLEVTVVILDIRRGSVDS